MLFIILDKTARGLFFVIKKKDPGPYWPRLLNEPKEGNQLVIIIR